MLSLQASYAAPLILLAQNRQTDRDRVQAEQDRQRAERNLADTEFLAREMAALRIALSEVATRDFVRSELRNLLEDLTAERETEPERDAETPERGRKAPRALGRDATYDGPPCRTPPTPCSMPSARRSRACSTRRSAARSPSSAWSAPSRSTGRRRRDVVVGIDLTTAGLPAQGHAHARRQRRGRPRSRASTDVSRRARRHVGRAARRAAHAAARHGRRAGHPVRAAGVADQGVSRSRRARAASASRRSRPTSRSRWRRTA